MIVQDLLLKCFCWSQEAGLLDVPLPAYRWRSTPNPMLLMNQTYDPNTGYRNALHAAHYLGHAVLLTQEDYGHLWFQDPSKCVEEKMVDYLVNLSTPPPGTVCQSDHQRFDPQLQTGTENVERNLP
jgi:hypothetical protein